MRLEDMKKDIPETPEFIHMMIQSEVKKQLENAKVVPIPIHTGRVKKWTGARVAAAVAVCIMATSITAYAGGRLYHMFLEKQGTYGIVTGIKSESSSEKIDLPEKIHGIDFSAGYIPSGMSWSDEFHLEYPEHHQTGGFSFSDVLLDQDDLSKVMQDKNVIDCEERTFGSYEGIYLKYNDLSEDGSFNQRIYLLCPEIYRVITVYIGDDISKEDAIRVAENLVITENDTIIETDGLYTWSELVSPEELSAKTMITSISDDQLPVHQIGEAFDMTASGEDSHGELIEENKISVCVDSLQVEDDLQLLGEDDVPEEWIDVVGSDGKLVNNTLSYIKSGDGIDSVDEIVKTESVKQKLVYATVTYTNTSNEAINHMRYLGTLMLMNHEEGIYQIYDPSEQSGEDYDRVIWNGAARTSSMRYYSVSEDYGNGGNYISSIEPGESIQVNMAWIVNENDLDHMYLNLNGDGGAFQFTDSTLKSGVVDICR